MSDYRTYIKIYDNANLIRCGRLWDSDVEEFQGKLNDVAKILSIYKQDPSERAIVHKNALIRLQQEVLPHVSCYYNGEPHVIVIGFLKRHNHRRVREIQQIYTFQAFQDQIVTYEIHHNVETCWHRDDPRYRQIWELYPFNQEFRELIRTPTERDLQTNKNVS